MEKVKCGDANPKGNIALKYKGGCGEELNMEDAYRCTGCGGWFHKECILKHFKLERKHDVGRNDLKKEIINIINNKIYHELWESGKKRLIILIKKL